VTTHDYHEEEVLGKAYDARLMKRLLAFFKPHWHRVVLSVILVLFTAAIALIGPYLTKIAIDDFITKGDLRGLSFVATLFFLSLFAQMVIEYWQLTLTQITGQEIMYAIRTRLFAKLQRLSLSFFDRTPVGRLMTRITNDVDVLNELFTSGVVSIVGDVFTLIGIMIAMVLLNAELALVCFTVMPIIFIASMIFRAKVRQSYRDVRTRLARINANLNENITGMSTVQLTNREQRNYEEYSELNAGYRDANLRSIHYYALFFPVVELISALALGLIIWYGGRQIMWAGLSLGALVAFIQYTGRFFRPIQDLSEKYNILQSAMASSERIFDLLDTEEDLKEPLAPKRAEPFRGEIRFEHVYFSYKEGEVVLKDISLHVAPGERVAIVGATGSGKTTIINLLSRFYDVKGGHVFVDGIDVRDWDLAILRRSIGVVLQDVFLFSGTIADNIRLGERSITDEQMIAAAREVHADHLIDRLPGGYGGEVKERGATFSVGEKQLLSFARCLAFDPKILVLDEATSSVDTETELLIQDALHRLMEGRTSVVIAHRLSTIQDVDRIVVIHKGEIREEGTHQDLLARRGIYHRLYQLQYQAQERAGAGSGRRPAAQ
jgi:ATP-binding cassette subfamily B multidrug efflux pump